MSDDPFEQKLRALDDVNAPDQWNDITDRAAPPEVHASGPGIHGRARQAVLIAAAALLVVAIGAGLLATTGHDDAVDMATDDGSSSVSTDPPEQVWGRVWMVQAIDTEVGPMEIPVPNPAPDGSTPSAGSIALDLRTEGVLRYTGCNSTTAKAEVIDDRMVGGPEWMSTVALCLDDRLDQIDEQMSALLRAEPGIELRGDALTLRAGATTATLVSGGPGDASAPVGEPPSPIYSHDPSSEEPSCVAFLEGRPIRPGGDPDERVPLDRGPSAPDVQHERRSGIDGGYYHLQLDDQMIDVRVLLGPGVEVFGSTIETVELDGRGPATLRTSSESAWVQYFPTGGSRNPCPGFEITVTGGAEAANRQLALDVADRLVTGVA